MGVATSSLVLAEVAVILVGASYVAAHGPGAARSEPALSETERQQLRVLPAGGSVGGEFIGGLRAPRSAC